MPNSTQSAPTVKESGSIHTAAPDGKAARDPIAKLGFIYLDLCPATTPLLLFSTPTLLHLHLSLLSASRPRVGPNTSALRSVRFPRTKDQRTSSRSEPQEREHPRSVPIAALG